MKPTFRSIGRPGDADLAFPKPFSIVSPILRASARGQRCTLRLPEPGLCRGHDTSTTVLCHLQGVSGGLGMKVNDLHAVYGCCDCHDVIDGRRKNHGLSDAIILDAIIRALDETHSLMFEAGLVNITKRNPRNENPDL